MDFDDSAEEAKFRAEVRAWLAGVAAEYKTPPAKPYSDAELVARAKAWQRKKADAGYAAILWPKEVGGRAGTRMQHLIFIEEEQRYHIPTGAFVAIGFGMAVPTVMAHGTPEQVKRLAGPTLRGEITWCQLFSEPGAGSDLAGLRTRAVKTGGKWLVNGQKVWSSWAHHADWGIILARTDTSVVKHKGLTFFFVDMKTKGIDVRPIKQISGKSDFSETFLTDVEIPDENRVGAPGDGWKCAMTTLMNERMGSGGPSRASVVGIEALIARAREIETDDGPAITNSAVREKLARWYAIDRGIHYFRYRILTQLSKGQSPGAEAAVPKLASASKQQELCAFAMDLQDLGGLIGDAALNPGQAEFIDDFFWSAAMRIAGGADEILRNQIAERVLGLPGDIRADKDLPFDQLPSGR